jgi:hypothetical protein
MSDYQPFEPNQNNNPDSQNQDYQPPTERYQQPVAPVVPTQVPLQGVSDPSSFQSKTPNDRRLLTYIILGLAALAIIPVIGMISGGSKSADSANGDTDTAASSRVSSSKKSNSEKKSSNSSSDEEDTDSASTTDTAAGDGTTATFTSGTLYSFATNHGGLASVLALNPGLTVDNYSSYYGTDLNVAN